MDNKKRFYFISLYAVIIFSLQFYLVVHSQIHSYKIVVLAISVFVTFTFFGMGKFLSVILNIISLFLILFDIYLVHICGVVTDGNIIAISGTSLDLALSMLSTAPLSVMICAPVLLILSGYISFILGDFNKKQIKISLLLTSILILSITPSIVANINDPDRLYRNSFMNIAAIIKHHLSGMPGDVLFGIVAYMHPGDPLFVNPLPKHKIINTSLLGKNGERIHNIIFIMGESSLRKRYGIYGYKKADTTPVLNELQQKGRICVIKNAHSAANTTRQSVPMTFSFYGPKTRDALISEKNIIELAQEHNYKTYWISTQGGTGPYDRTYGYISEYSNFIVRGDLNNKKYGVIVQKDDTLLPVIEKTFSENNPYKLYIIHIYGSHQKYKHKVTPDDIKALPVASDYDRTIHHTDRLIGQIIKLADKELGNYTLIYTSDHGEVVGKGHGLQFGGYDQYKIPFLIKDPSHKYCDLVQSFEEKRGYYTSLANKYILLSMLGYHFSEEEIEKLIPEDIIIHSDDKVYKYSDLPKNINY